MAQSSAASQKSNKYFSDAENAREMARLVKQGQLYTRITGGALYGLESCLPRFRNVLDLACGPGVWALDVASLLPAARVMGVDISQTMISYAQYIAEEQNVYNAQFRCMDITQPLDFPDNSFDLVNARLLCSFMSAERWPLFLQECFRIARPGGIVRMTECERWVGNTPAFERITYLLVQALHRAHKTFSPSDDVMGVTIVLNHMFRQTGFRHIQMQSFQVDFSVGAEAHQDLYEDVALFFQLTRPFMLEMGVVAEREASILYDQALKELRSSDFCGAWPYLCVYGEKPQ